MASELISQLLDENKAYWDDGSQLGLLLEKSLVREWKHIPVEHRDACLTELRSRRSYTNPKTQTKSHTGVYRIQKIEDIVEKDKMGNTGGITIRETLAFGLASSLTNEQPRLVSGLYLPSTSKNQAASPAHTSAATVEENYKSIVIRYVNLDPNYLDAIISARTNLSETNISVAGETLAGPWYILSRKPGWSDDGSGILEEKWGLAGWHFEASGKTGTLDTSAVVYVQGVPKDRVQTVLTAELAKVSTTYGTAGLKYEQKIYWREDSADIMIDAVVDNPVNDDHVANRSKAKYTSRYVYKNEASLPDVSATTSQGEIESISGNINSTGKVDYVKDVDVSIVQTVAIHDASITKARTETSKTGKNLRDADLSNYSIAQSNGTIQRLGKTINDDGTYDVTVSVSTVTDQTATTVTASDQHLESDARIEDTVSHTAAANPADDVAYSTQGVIVETNNSPNEDGTFSTTQKTVTSVKQEVAEFDSETLAARTETTKSGKNLRDGDLSSYTIAQEAGKTKRRTKTINEDGTYDVVVSSSSSTNQTASTDATHSDQHLDTEDRTEDTTRQTAAASPVADVDFSVQGTVTETENAPNDDGTFRTSVKTIVSKEQQINSAVVTEEKFKQIVTDIGKNIKTSTLGSTYPVSATTGEVVTRRLSKNQDGTYDVSRDRDVAKTVASAETTSEIQAFETITRDIDRNNTAADTPPVSQTAGTIVGVTNKVNEYNRYDVITETRTATAVSNAEKVKRITASETDTSVVNKNQTSALTQETSFTTGTITTTTSELNAYGRYTNKTDASVATYVSDSGSYSTKEGTAYWWWGINATVSDYNSAVSTASLDGTTDNTISKTINKYGLIDYAIHKRPYGGMYYVWGESITSGLTKKAREYANLFSSSAGRVKRYYRDITYTYSIAIKNNWLAAEQYIDGGEDGSEVKAFGSGRYAGFKIASITRGAWTADDIGDY